MFEALGKRGKIVMLTAYDCQMAKILEEVGVDIILVGDSLGMVVLGYENTKRVTLDEMLHHTKAVARCVKRTLIVGDMPVGSYGTAEKALENAKKFLKAGAHGVKVEGCEPEVVAALLGGGVPVMGHVGLLPQTAEKHRVSGRSPEEAQHIFEDALTLDDLGVFAIVIECVPRSLAKKITEAVKSPTIGIGAGKHCDGQVLVTNDLLGFDLNFNPRFLKRYADLNTIIKEATSKFKSEVLKGRFPDEEHSYS